jgi:hypothetical protein
MDTTMLDMGIEVVNYIEAKIRDDPSERVI